MYTSTEILNKSPIQNFEIYPLFATVKVKSKVKLRGINSTQETKWYLFYFEFYCFLNSFLLHREVNYISLEK
jgi:hypothetical protein